MSDGLEIGFPIEVAQGLAGAKPSDLSKIEITPTGLGLHWPRLDADLYRPALMEGIFGSRRWMAQLIGTAGGRARSTAKRAAVRKNGRLGGRPRRDIASAPFLPFRIVGADIQEVDRTGWHIIMAN
ncbi:MAG: DUF2442 domain-containing protein [Steroidobacteraceae bacterium]